MARKLFFLIASALLICPHYAFLVQARDVEPKYNEYARMARYLVHRMDWTSMGTISTVPEILNYPMVSIVSYADSARGEKSTGEFYMLLTANGGCGPDLEVNKRVTVLVAMAQYKKNCKDPMDPLCARVMISGTIKKIEEGTEEHDFGMKAMISRHPDSDNWDVKTHTFYLHKIEIQHMMIKDFYEAPVVIPVEEYFAADPSLFVPRRKSYKRTGRRGYYKTRTFNDI